MSNSPIFPAQLGRYLDVRTFAPADYPRDGKPSHDWQPYIQAAINYLMSQPISGDTSPFGQVATLYLPPGMYHIKSPIMILKVTDGEFVPCSVKLVGESSGSAFSNVSQLTMLANNLPAIVIQDGISVRIEHLQIKGPGYWPSKLNPSIVAAQASLTDAMFGPDSENLLYLYNQNSPTHPLVDNQYAPSAGIVIDPFVNPQPQNIYASLSGYYVNNTLHRGSSAIQIRDCAISGFAVGVGLSLSGHPLQLNCENITIIDTAISNVKTAIAIGQSQTRNIILRNVIVSSAKTYVNCTDYGSGLGNCPSIFGGGLDHIKYVFRTFSFLSGASINGLRGEALVSVGLLGGGGNRDGLVFNGCCFDFLQTPVDKANNNASRYPAVYRLGNLTQTSFNGCTFSIDQIIKTGETMYFQNNWWISFRNSTFVLNVPDGVDAPPFWIFSNPERVTFDNCQMGDLQPYAAVLSNVMPVDDLHNRLVNNAILPGTLFYNVAGGPGFLRRVASGYPMIDLGTPTVELFSNGTATFPYIGAARKLHPGDIISTMSMFYPYTSTPKFETSPILPVIGQVKSTDATTVTLQYVPDYVFNDVSSKSPVGPPFFLPAGTQLFLQYVIRAHDAGITKANNSANPLPNQVIVSNPQSWAVGNRITIEDKNPPFSTCTPPGTYVTAVNGSTLTLSDNATVIGIGFRVYDADIREVTTTRV